MSAIQNNDQYIGQLLVADGVITTGDLERGLDEQKKTRDHLCSTLVKLGFATEEKIFSILSLQIGVPFMDLKDFKISPQFLIRIPAAFAQACKFVPLRQEGDCFYVAMADPLDSQTVEEIQAYLGVDRLKVFLAGEEAITETLRVSYLL